MSLRDKLMAGPKPVPEIKRTKLNHPRGWEPRVTVEGDKASGVVACSEANPDHEELLRGMGLNPDNWSITGPVKFTRWQQRPGDEFVYYHSFKAENSGVLAEADPEFDDACAKLLNHKPRAPKARPVKHARVICLADWQVGKGEGGGSAALAQRINDMVDEAVALVKRTKPDAVYVVGMGDMVERCMGNYPSQAFTSDLNQREQERFARRGILGVVKALAPLVPRLVVSCVPGNHGEVRNGDGKAFTSPGDNADVAVFEQVMDILEIAPAYKHVSWVIPGEDLTVTLDIAGTPVTFAHGHQFRKGGTVQAKAVEWWKGAAFSGFDPVSSKVLVSGHYHHFQALSTHGRLWLQCPSLDGGSQWFTNTTGEYSLPGTLTFAVNEDGACGIQILGDGGL